jgi:hypothetical protein
LFFQGNVEFGVCYGAEGKPARANLTISKLGQELLIP